MKRLAIIGSGDLGQLISHYATANSLFELAGYFDDFQQPGNRVGTGVVLGRTDHIGELYKDGRFDELLVGVGYNHFKFRQEIFERFAEQIPFARVVSSTAYVDESCSLGQGVIILPGCVLDRRVAIEDNVFLNVGCVVAHDCVLGAHSFLAPGVTLSGNVTLGSSSFVGVGATIINRVRLCDGSKIGGGAVVVRDTTETDYYIGVPARPIHRKS